MQFAKPSPSGLLGLNSEAQIPYEHRIRNSGSTHVIAFQHLASNVGHTSTPKLERGAMCSY